MNEKVNEGARNLSAAAKTRLAETKWSRLRSVDPTGSWAYTSARWLVRSQRRQRHVSHLCEEVTRGQARKERYRLDRGWS